MTRYNRRTLLKAGAAFAGVSAIGCPAIVRAQAARIKIGHLVPLTGFLGAIGSYAQLGVKMAAEEINASGGIMGRHLKGLVGRHEAVSLAWLCDIDPAQIEKAARLIDGFQPAPPRRTAPAGRPTTGSRNPRSRSCSRIRLRRPTW